MGKLVYLNDKRGRTTGTPRFPELYAALAGLGYRVTHFAGEGIAYVHNPNTGEPRTLTTDDLCRLLERWDGGTATLPGLLRF